MKVLSVLAVLAVAALLVSCPLALAADADADASAETDTSADALDLAGSHLKQMVYEAAGDRERAQTRMFSDDNNGGTAVILANKNKVVSERDNKAEIEAAKEARKKRLAEETDKHNYEQKVKKEMQHSREQDTKHHRELRDRRAVRREAKHQAAIKAQKEEYEKKKQKKDGEEEAAKKGRGDSAAAAQKEREQQLKDASEHRIISGRFKPKRRHQIAASSRVSGFSSGYMYMFWVKPMGKVSGWSNLLHKGSRNGERSPAVWFYPGRTRLHIRTGSSRSWNDGYDPRTELQMGKYYHVAFAHGPGRLRVWLNGKLVGDVQMRSGPKKNSGPLYASDPWYRPANAYIADVRYVPNTRDAAGIVKRAYGMKPWSS